MRTSNIQTGEKESRQFEREISIYKSQSTNNIKILKKSLVCSNSLFSLLLNFEFVCDLEFANWSLSVLGGKNV